MPAKQPDSTSTDLALRWFAPQPVACAYARAQCGLSGPHEKLGYRLGLVEVVQRYLLAVLGAYHAGRGFEAGARLKRLFGEKFETPSLGDVSLALEEVARRLAEEELPDEIEVLVALLFSRIEGGQRVRTKFAQDLQYLNDVRNRGVHSPGSPVPHFPAVRELLEETKPIATAVCRELRCLKHLQVLFIETMHPRQDGSTLMRVFEFIGQHPDARDLVLPEQVLGLLPRVPFVLLTNGDILFLTPFAIVAQNELYGGAELRLLDRWDSATKTFLFSDVHGSSRRAAPEDLFLPASTPRECLALAPDVFLRAGALSADAVRSLTWSVQDDVLPQFDGYKVEHRLGMGASSTVYSAREETSGPSRGRIVAIKVLHSLVAGDTIQRRRLEHEYEILSDLEHPAIVKVRKLISAPSPALVLEYVEGEDLQSIVAREPLDVARAVEIVEQVLGALRAAHARNVVHRDIKPSNVLIDADGQARLIDFGIAAAERLPRQTRTLDAVGTFGFAAPEQLSRASRPGPTADIFGVGQLLAFLLTGEVRRSALPEVPSGSKR